MTADLLYPFLFHDINQRERRYAHPTAPTPLPSRQRSLSDYKTSNAALVAADMVKHRLDNVRRDADIGHACRDRPANVVNGPTAHTGTFVEQVLLVRPGRKLEYCVTNAR